MLQTFKGASHGISVCQLLLSTFGISFIYPVFLAQLVLTIAFLLCEVILPPHISLISIPYRLLLEWMLPDVYASDPDVKMHPYIASGLLFVSVTTLVLVFASGMYSEKIAYANK